MLYDRTHYASRPTAELQRLYHAAEDRSTRADTTEAYLTDAFAMQEIAAVLIGRNAAIPDSPEPNRFQGDC